MSTSVLPESERIDLTHTKAPTLSGPQPGRKPKRHWLPYALVAPAILFELLIHIVPMLTGIWISFMQLTKYFIANWGAAPFAGLRNYSVAIDFDQAIVLEFPVSTLTALLVHRPDIARSFEVASARVEAIHVEHIVRLSSLSAIARTAHFLLELGQRLNPQHSDADVVFYCPLTQSDFADALGMTPIHVNRTLRKLRALGLVTIEKKSVRILDWARLCRLSEFSSEYLRDDATR